MCGFKTNRLTAKEVELSGLTQLERTDLQELARKNQRYPGPFSMPLNYSLDHFLSKWGFQLMRGHHFATDNVSSPVCIPEKISERNSRSPSRPLCQDFLGRRLNEGERRGPGVWEDLEVAFARSQEAGREVVGGWTRWKIALWSWFVFHFL